MKIEKILKEKNEIENNFKEINCFFLFANNLFFLE